MFKPCSFATPELGHIINQLYHSLQVHTHFEMRSKRVKLLLIDLTHSAFGGRRVSSQWRHVRPQRMQASPLRRHSETIQPASERSLCSGHSTSFRGGQQRQKGRTADSLRVRHSPAADLHKRRRKCAVACLASEEGTPRKSPLLLTVACRELSA